MLASWRQEVILVMLGPYTGCYYLILVHLQVDLSQGGGLTWQSSFTVQKQREKNAGTSAYEQFKAESLM